MGQPGWLSEPSLDDITDAIHALLPELGPAPIAVRPARDSAGPGRSRGVAIVDDRLVAKFACSERHAAGILREGLVLQLLGRLEPAVPVPPVLAVGHDPALFITELVPGRPLGFADALIATAAGAESVGRELGRHLAALHRDEVRRAMAAAGLDSVRPQPQATTDALRQRLTALVAPDEAARVRQWCDWTDQVLATDPPPESFVHGDLHGYNELWDFSGPTLQALVDLEECGLADPHYDFRYLPAQAPSLALVASAMASYQQAGGRALTLARVMAWHVRTCLGDALWRTEAGVALPDGGTVSGWIGDLTRRLEHAGTPDF